VQQGDTLNVIAANFELDPKTLFWGNPDTLTNVHMLSVGMDLNILPVDGVLHVSDGKMTVAQIAQEYEVEPFDILDSPYNSLYAFMPEDYVPKGERVVVPGGQGDETDWVWNPEVAYSGDSSSSGSSTAGKVRFSPSDPGSCGWQEIAYGTGAFSNPIPSGGYTITQWFSAWHSGIDLAGTTGTPVVASDGGRVIFAGWNNFGFGNLVVIVHGATMSFYGHLNGISVRCGQVISAGTQVGTMGNTGRSSGPHLHFEIRYNDIPTDPALYTTF
jgi:murein DD-endopeptidase MepM/ murein hydrolase activator NlpD